MAITYAFKCPNCSAEEEIYTGSTRFGKEDYKLGTCSNCKRLTHTLDNRCPHCGAKAETGKWFYKKTGFKLIDLSSPANARNIPCPKCKYEYLNTSPIIFHD